MSDKPEGVEIEVSDATYALLEQEAELRGIDVGIVVDELIQKVLGKKE